MKSISRILVAFVLSLSLVGLVYAQPSGVNLQQAATAVEENVPYEDFKAQVLSRIDKVITRVEGVEAKINASKLDSGTKQILTDALEKMKGTGDNDGLEDYRVKVEGTTTYDELKVVNEDLKTMLQASKEDIIAAFKESALAVAQNAMATFEAFNDEMDAELDSLLETCPDQKEAITDLQSQNDQLENQIKVLSTDLQEKDVEAVKADVASLAALSKDMVENKKAVSQGCATTSATTTTEE